jgi:hypothetical protein
MAEERCAFDPDRAELYLLPSVLSPYGNKNAILEFACCSDSSHTNH